MKNLKLAAASAAVAVLAGAGGAFAADLSTKAPVYKAPVNNVCTSIMDFFTTACQLSAYGVRFYGTVDVGYGYETNGAKFDQLAGANYFLQKMNSGGKWLLSPNALTPSNVGVQVKEALGGGWSFVGQLETAFNPYSLRLLNGVHSVYTQVGVPLIDQTAVGDSNSQGQFYNTLGFAGFSNGTWGTLTFFRQNSLGQDLYLSYDPMGVAPGFAVPGFFGGYAGGGDTQNRRDTTAVKYRVAFANWHFGAYGQFGNYEDGNGAQGSIQGDVGADWKVGPGLLSADVVGGYRKDAVTVGLGGPVTAAGLGIPTAASTMTATITNNTEVILGLKYTMERLKLMAGYEWIQQANASDHPTAFTDIGGDFVCANCQGFNGTNINSTPFAHGDKILQLAWFGGQYDLTNSLKLSAAYYHVWQNDFSGGVGSASNATTCAQVSTAQSSCAGTLDAFTVLLDWKFAPKWDTYIGTVYNVNAGGIDNGYLAKQDWSTTAGIRFRW